MEVTLKLHSSAALPSEKKLQHPLNRRLCVCVPKSRAGQLGEKEILAATGNRTTDPRSTNRIAKCPNIM